MFVKPILPKKSTQSQHWQFDGFHFRVFSLRDDKVLAFLISAGIEFQITGPKCRIEPLPHLTELILGMKINPSMESSNEWEWVEIRQSYKYGHNKIASMPAPVIYLSCN